MDVTDPRPRRRSRTCSSDPRCPSTALSVRRPGGSSTLWKTKDRLVELSLARDFRDVLSRQRTYPCRSGSVQTLGRQHHPKGDDLCAPTRNRLPSRAVVCYVETPASPLQGGSTALARRGRGRRLWCFLSLLFLRGVLAILWHALRPCLDGKSACRCANPKRIGTGGIGLRSLTVSSRAVRVRKMSRTSVRVRRTR
jgi:hypothetical protein